VTPQTVGQYELGELVGSGTVGSAYRARHLESGQVAVVKLLQSYTAQDLDIQRRFVREVSIAERLNHPNIVRHYDCGLSDGQIYFAMELVDCGTLKDVLIRRGTLPWREAVECAIQICAALDHAHQFGIIHRDLKPANLFLSADGHLKVGDFGLARDLHSSRLTLDGQTVGTCRYMPPEQISGADELTGAVDLYALGCILFEMLVGRVPFDGGTIIEVFEAHMHSNVTPPAELVPDCPPDLSDLVVCLLAKDPQERPASAAIVRGALVDILHGRPMRHVAPEPEELEADLMAASDPSKPNLTERLHAGTASGRQPISGSRAMAIFAVIAALIAIVVFIASTR
jgi:serine/threonine protein kinase